MPSITKKSLKKVRIMLNTQNYAKKHNYAKYGNLGNHQFSEKIAKKTNISGIPPKILP